MNGADLVPRFATSLLELVPVGLERAAALHGIRLPARVLVRHLDGVMPHFWRDQCQWVCRSRMGPCGYGSTYEEAHEDWKRARLDWARTPTPEQGKSRPLMAHVGQFPMTEDCHVSTPNALSRAG